MLLILHFNDHPSGDALSKFPDIKVSDALSQGWASFSSGRLCRIVFKYGETLIKNWLEAMER